MQKIIYSLKVFLQLSKLGYEPLATMPNPNNNNLTCWIFEKTPNFIRDLDKIIKEGL